MVPPGFSFSMDINHWFPGTGLNCVICWMTSEMGMGQDPKCPGEAENSWYPLAFQPDNHPLISIYGCLSHLKTCVYIATLRYAQGSYQFI